MRLLRQNLKIPLSLASVIATLPLLSTVEADTPSIAPRQPDNVSYGIDAGIGETDNIGLVNTDKVSQTIATTDIDFSVQEATRLLDANLKGNFSYLDYLEHAFGSDLVGRFDGIAHAAIIPERLTWTLQDDFGQGQISAFGAPTPQNRENINYLSTGPNVNLRFAGTGFVDLSARFARAQYSNSPYDSDRYQGSLAVGDRLSADSIVSLNGDVERVLFQDTAVATDFERSSVYGRYETIGVRTSLTGNLGATEVTQGGMSTTGPLAKLQITRKISHTSSVNLTLTRELTDASTGFSTAQVGAIGGISTTPPAVTANSYTSETAAFGWSYARNRTTFALSARWEKDDYSTQPLLNVTRSGGEFNLEEHLTHLLSVQILGSLYDTDYAHANFDPTLGPSTFVDSRIGAAMTLREGRGLVVRLRFDHLGRSISNDPSAIPYGANTVFLTVGYRPLPADSVQSGADDASN